MPVPRAIQIKAAVLLCGSSLSAHAAAETLTDYASRAADARRVIVTSKTGQQLLLSAYGNYIVRVRALRRGETLFADNRYQMVVPENHTKMVSTLNVTEDSASLRVTTNAPDGLTILIHKQPLRLELLASNGAALLAKEDAAHSLGWTDGANSTTKETWSGVQPGEHLFKAGTDFYGRSTALDRTGTTSAWNYADSTNLGPYQAPVSVPFYLSTLGYGVFFNTAFDTSFSFGEGGRYELSASDKHSAGVKPQLDYFFIAGPQLTKIIDRYTELTGRPRLPREAIFGLQLSDKNFPKSSGSQWWEDKITAHRNAGFPLDVQVNDNRWRDPNGLREGSQFMFWTSPGGSWNQPTPQAFKAWADAHGVVTVLDYNRNNSNEMWGWRAGGPPGYSFAPADLERISDKDAAPDWSSPATRDWLWSALWKTLDPALGLPGDAIWLDETDELGKIPDAALCANGFRWAELRNEYSLLLQQAVGEGWDRQIGARRRPWTFSRSATAGMQRYGHFWSGDIDSTYSEMAAQVRGIQAIGLGGFPFANHDAGGFHGRVISPEMYRQWVAAFASFAPIWRPHSEADTSALGVSASRWPLDHSPVEQAEFAKYAHERYRLMPYIYSMAREAATTGMPLARAMVLGYQNNPQAWSHDLQYQWGPSFLVAPNASDGGAPVKVWLPAGDTWYYFWNDRQIVGSDTADYDYSPATGELPLFVKAGAIIPRYPFAQSVQAMDKTQLELDAYAGKNGAFQLLEDDGVSEDWHAASKQLTTAVSFESAAMRVAIRQPSGLGYQGAPRARSYIVRFHGYAKPVGMRLDGGRNLRTFESESDARAAGAGVVWDEARKLLSVVTSAIPVLPGDAVATIIEPSGAPFSAASAAAPNAVSVTSLRSAPGCGCRIASAPRSDPSRFAVLALSLALLKRRRR
jgi:alpha-glucosidase (family GH31 glycosyl hydrolase)